jgi:hypothetical protein
VQNDADNVDGWGHWALGPVQDNPQPMEVEQQVAPNNQLPVLPEEVDMGDEDHGPPILDATSYVQISSSSSEGTSFQGPAESEILSAVTLPITNFPHHEQPLGEGLSNIIQAYPVEEENEESSAQPENNDTSLGTSESQGAQLIEDSLFLPDNV